LQIIIYNWYEIYNKNIKIYKTTTLWNDETPGQVKHHGWVRYRNIGYISLLNLNPMCYCSKKKKTILDERSLEDQSIFLNKIDTVEKLNFLITLVELLIL
jgi:hypothetical protein